MLLWLQANEKIPDWAWGLLVAALIGAIGALFRSQVKSNDSTNKDIDALRTLITDHAIACGEKTRQEAITATEVRHLAERLPAMSNEFQGALAREIRHFQELQEAHHCINENSFAALNSDVATLIRAVLKGLDAT